MVFIQDLVDYQGVATEADVAGQVNLINNIIATKPAGILMAATDASITTSSENGIKQVFQLLWSILVLRIKQFHWLI